jgi:hypothetical protein
MEKMMTPLVAEMKAVQEKMDANNENFEVL